MKTASIEDLKKLVSYDPDTGVFVRTSGPNPFFIGKPAGSLTSFGHVAMWVGGNRYYAHRLAFAFMTGSWPSGQIDHIDGNPSNNKWNNLRDGTVSMNQHNKRAPYKNNASGYLGVFPVKKTSKYRACINFSGGKKHLGTFDSALEAHEAYLAAKRAYHPTAPESGAR